MNLQTSYSASPGHCISCGNSQGRDVIDTGANIDFYGAVYFCSQCAKDMGYTVGLVDNAPVAKDVTSITKEEFVNELDIFSASLNDGLFDLTSLIRSIQGNLPKEASESESADGIVRESDELVGLQEPLGVFGDSLDG